MIMTREKFIDYFGMTPEKAKYILTKFRQIVNAEVHHVIENADFYINPQDYGCESDVRGMPFEKDEDSDGYTCLYEYGVQHSAEYVFMRLISGDTRYGGHTSAIRACELMGIDWEEESRGW